VQAKQTFTHYFALGDSISTDDYPGEGRGAASLFYKHLRAICSRLSFHCLAQDGATTIDVLHRQLSQLPQKLRGKPLFTLTAGGNDVLALQAEAGEIIFRLQTIVKRLIHTYSNSVVIIGTIYDPTDTIGDLMEDQPTLIRELACVTEVNETIRNMEGSNVAVADIYAHFLGHGSHSKDPQNPWYHPEDPSLWYLMDIEPNVRGAKEACSLFEQAFTKIVQR